MAQAFAALHLQSVAVLALDGFDIYIVHKLSRAEIQTRGRWVRSENAATRPPHAK